MCKRWSTYVRKDEVHSGEISLYKVPYCPKRRSSTYTESRKFRFAAVLRLKKGMYKVHPLFVFIQEVDTQRLCPGVSDCWDKFDLDRLAALLALGCREPASYQKAWTRTLCLLAHLHFPIWDKVKILLWWASIGNYVFSSICRTNNHKKALWELENLSWSSKGPSQWPHGITAEPKVSDS